MLFVHFLKTFVAGWIYDIEKQVHDFEKKAAFCYFAANFGSVIIASGLWFGMKNKGDALWAGFTALAVIYPMGIGTTAYFLKQKMEENPGKWTWKSIAWGAGISFRNMFNLHDRLRATIGCLPWVWAFFMKQFILHLILILFINLMAANNAVGKSLFGHYGEYVSWPFQVLGILSVVFVLFLFVLGLVAPTLYVGLELIDDKILEEECVRKAEFKSYSEGKPDETEEVGDSVRDAEAGANSEEQSVEQPVD